MSVIPGWYPDPAEPTTQRYWDGEQWIGGPVPVDEEPPTVPPPSIEASAIPATLVKEPATPATNPARPVADPAKPPADAATPPADAVTPPADAVTPATGTAATDPVIAAAPVTSWPPGGLALAPLIYRLAARLIDICVVSVLTIVVNSYFFISFYQEVSPQIAAIRKALTTGATPPDVVYSERATRLLIVMTFTAIALWFAYEVPGTADTGQTPGKRILGIKTTRLDGAGLTFWQSSRRWMVLAVPSMLFPYGLPIQLLDCGWCLRDKPLRQCLHDKGVQTVVVLAPPARLADGPGPASPADRPVDPAGQGPGGPGPA